MANERVTDCVKNCAILSLRFDTLPKWEYALHRGYTFHKENQDV